MLPPPLLVILVHSPLVGPATWSRLVAALEAQCVEVVAPSLQADPARTPYWRHHADQIRLAVRTTPPDRPVVLVAHSGAGVLLPAIRQALGRPVAAYVFLDAIVPLDGRSRLDLFDTPESATAFRNAAKDGVLPMWTEERLRNAIPDSATRHRFVAELVPLPLAVYEEPVPVFGGWPDAPCAYLRFTPTYVPDAERAAAAGCEVRHRRGGHFQMLNAPDQVADDIVALLPQHLRPAGCRPPPAPRSRRSRLASTTRP